MSLEVRCDACKGRQSFDVGDDVYCQDCYSKLEAKIAELSGELDDANESIKELESEIQALETEESK